MIALTAEITVFSNENGEIDLYYSDLTMILHSNISAPLFEMVNKYDTGIGNGIMVDNPLILGQKIGASIFGGSKLGEGRVFGKADYFVSRAHSNEYGDFSGPARMLLYGNIKSLTFVFDTVNGGHPKQMLVDGHLFTDDDPIYTISDTTNIDIWDDSKTAHEIEIRGWNKPNSPIIIQGIYITPRTLQIDRRNLISMESSIFDRSDIKLPSWGIISNGGSITFNDANGEIKDYAEQGLLTSNQKVQIYLNDTLSKFKQKVADLYTTEWDYDEDNRVVSVSLKDSLERLQEITFNELNLIDLTGNRYYSATNIYFLIRDRQSVPNDVLFPSFADLDLATQTVLNNTYVKSVVIPNGTYWSAWTKLCELCQLHVYKNYNGKIVVKYNGGT